MNYEKIGTISNSLLTKTLSLTEEDWNEYQTRKETKFSQTQSSLLGATLPFYIRPYKDIALLNENPFKDLNLEELDKEDDRRFFLEEPDFKKQSFNSELDEFKLFCIQNFGDGLLIRMRLFKVKKNSSYIQNFIQNDSTNLVPTLNIKKLFIPLVVNPNCQIKIQDDVLSVAPLDVWTLSRPLSVINETEEEVIFARAIFKVS